MAAAEAMVVAEPELSLSSGGGAAAAGRPLVKRRKGGGEPRAEQEEHSLSLSQHSSPSRSDQEQTKAAHNQAAPPGDLSTVAAALCQHRASLEFQRPARRCYHCESPSKVERLLPFVINGMAARPAPPLLVSPQKPPLPLHAIRVNFAINGGIMCLCCIRWGQRSTGRWTGPLTRGS